jgi:TolB-like protein/Tfp pilus assembly protein PilF
MYAVVGWLILQVIAVLTPSLHLPDWVDTFFAVAIIAGFPIALLLAWAFEITPEGVKRTEGVEDEDAVRDKMGRRLDIAILVSLIAVACLIIGTRSNGGSGSEETAGASIAVMAFADMSAGQDQAYFSDGISEELLNLLAQIPELSVAGRTSSFSFKGKDTDIRQIGEILNVDHVLEGSVRKSGDRIRVTAQLIKTTDGFHLWSENYDRKLDDIFAVQDEISAAILKELMPRIMGKNAPVASAKRTDISAYELYLSAQQKAALGSFGGYSAASADIDKALAIDPDYVPALAWRGYYELMMSDLPGAVGNIPAEQALENAKTWVDRAIKLDPSSADALFAKAGLFSFSFDKDVRKTAETFYELALEARPTFPLARNDLGYLYSELGRIDDAVVQYEQVLSHDPGHSDANNNLLTIYRLRNESEKAKVLIDRWMRISPENGTPLGYAAAFARDTGALAQTIDIRQRAIALDPSNQRTQRDKFRDYLNIGEFDIDLPESLNYLVDDAFLFQGLKEEALKVARTQIEARPDYPGGQAAFATTLYLAGAFDELVAYYESNWGSLDNLQSTYNRPPYLNLALPLIEAGHPDGRKMVEAERTRVEEERGWGRDNVGLDLREAKLLVLEGKEDEALRMLESAYLKGTRSFYMVIDPGYAPLYDLPEYQVLIAKLADAVNRERAKINLPPMELPKPL